MTSPQPFRKFLSLAVCAAGLVGLAACSSKDEPSSSGTAGSTGAAGSANSQAGTGTGAAGNGTAGSGSGAAGSGTAGNGPTGSTELVGTFQIQGVVDEKDETTGITKVVGQVGDGPIPSNVVWIVAKEDGDCKLETPMVPFCEEPCGADVCVADNECQAYPSNHSVGTVTLTGLALAEGGNSVTLKEIAKAYQPPAGTLFKYPAFGAADEIKLQATGGDFSAFELSTPGVDPLQITTTDYALEEGKAFPLAWAAADDPKASKIYVKLDISHHGGIRGMIECLSDDDGGLTISADLMTELIGLGVAGFPSVVIMRQSIDTAQIEPGIVKLEVSSRVERYVSIAGVESCTTDEDCPEGKTCRTTDSTCQ